MFRKIFTLTLVFYSVIALPNGKIDDEISSDEVEAIKEVKAILPTIESDLKWKFELEMRNPSTMSLIEEVGTEYKEIEFERKVADYKSKLNQYRDEINSDKDLQRQIDMMRELVACSDDGISYDDIQVLIEDLEEEDLDSASEVVGLNMNAEDNDGNSISKEWIEWREKFGRMMRRKYQALMTSYRAFSKCNGVSARDMFLYAFEDKTIIDDLEAAIKELDPLYLQLHAHLRHLINQSYNITAAGSGRIREDILDFVLKQDNYKRISKFKEVEFKPHSGLTELHLADDFFSSLNMTKQSKNFWDYYAHLNPSTINCRPQAIAVPSRGYTGFRYCLNGSVNSFLETHYEMTKLHYVDYMKHLSAPYRLGLWPGFMEGVSKAVRLSAASSSYIDQSKLTESYSTEDNLDRLFIQALKDIVRLRLLYVREKLRLDILEEKIDSDNYNCEYWMLMSEYAGIEPPVERSIYDFDAAVYLRDFDTNGIKDMIEVFLGYQLYEVLCTETSQDTVLYNCNVSGKVNAGQTLTNIMQLGASKSWRDVVSVATRKRKLDSQAILKYYEPLLLSLRVKNYTVGWEKGNSCINEN